MALRAGSSARETVALSKTLSAKPVDQRLYNALATSLFSSHIALTLIGNWEDIGYHHPVAYWQPRLELTMRPLGHSAAFYVFEEIDTRTLDTPQIFACATRRSAS
jgi:hypothetical protein